MKFTTLLPVASIPALALSATIDVKVGPQLIYTPDTVTAKQGDVVRFHFGAGHNVVSGSFDSPCQPDNKIYSGEPNEGDTFSVTINGTSPVWIYCSVPSHCENGMAMVINPPSNHNINAYKQAASSVSSSNTPSKVMGGVLNAQSSSSSSSMSMSMSSSMSSSRPSGTASSSSMSGMSSASSTSAAPSSSASGSGASKALGSSSIVASGFAALMMALGLAV